MTIDQFNNKYKDYLVEGYYGLDINNPQIIEFLDIEFLDLIMKDNFKYYQIKEKFGMGRFYADGVSANELTEIENHITKLLKKDFNARKKQ